MARAKSKTNIWFGGEKKSRAKRKKKSSATEALFLASVAVGLGVAMTSVINSGIDTLATDVGGFINEYEMSAVVEPTPAKYVVTVTQQD